MQSLNTIDGTVAQRVSGCTEGDSDGKTMDTEDIF